MLTLTRIIDRLNTTIAAGTRWLALVMVVVTVLIVFLRYVVEIGAIPLQESVMYMHGLLFLLGIGYGVKQDTHVRVDLVYSKQPERRRRIINLVGHVVFLIPVSVFVFVTSLPYVQASWRVLEGSSEVGGIPGVFLLKTLLPVMAVLLFLQGVAEIVRALGDLRAQQGHKAR